MSLPGILVRNWRIKATSLALATLLWVTMQLRDEADTGRRDLTGVEVLVENADSQWMALGAPSPAAVVVGVHGTFGDLFRAALAGPVVVIPVDSVPGEDSVFELEPHWVENLDHDRVVIEGFSPSTVRLRFERMASEPVPVSYRAVGALPDSLAMTGDLRVNPLFVQAKGPASLVDDLETVFLEPFDLDALTGSGRFDVAVDTVGLEGVSVSPSSAVLTVEAATRGRRELGPLPVELAGVAGVVSAELQSGLPADAGELGSTPDSVVVTLDGAASLLAEVDATTVRVRAVLDLEAARARLDEGDEVRAPVVVEGLSADSWIEWAVEVDSVTVRRVGQSGGAGGGGREEGAGGA